MSKFAKLMNLTAIVNRLEVIDQDGRAYKLWLDEDFEVGLSFQDGGRTLKVFTHIPEDDK